MSEILNLNHILQNIRPNLVTPKLSNIQELSNTKKTKALARLIVEGLHKSIENPETMELIHENKIHKIRYFDISPLLVGIWPEVSLMLLNLSYGEQITLIETLYPKNIQLTAKAFATQFSKLDKTEQIQIQDDPKVLQKLDTANAGIAMILAKLGSADLKSNHPDTAHQELRKMNQLASDAATKAQYQQSFERSQQSVKHQDELTR